MAGVLKEQESPERDTEDKRSIQQILLAFLDRYGGQVTGRPLKFLGELRQALLREDGILLETHQIYSALCRLRNLPLGHEDGIWFIKNGTGYHHLAGYVRRKVNIDYEAARYLGEFKPM